MKSSPFLQVLTRLILPMLLALALPACRSAAPAPKNTPLPVVHRVDLQKYAGLWHEVSRLPNFFQKSCVRSTAEYTAQPDGTIAVKNTCYKTRARVSSVTGTATPVPGSGNARLKVKFGGLASLAPAPPETGNYWIIALDPAYRWTMVGTPDRKYLWILSRNTALPFPIYRALKKQAQDLGFDITRLVPEQVTPSDIADQTTPPPAKS